MTTTIADQMRRLLADHPPGAWFDLTSPTCDNPERLRVTLHQVAGRMDHIAAVTTRTVGSTVKACWFPKEG